MLTPKNIKARTAIEYFLQGYYQKGKWLGQGAAALGLSGEIKEVLAYENIIKGLSPDGNQKLFGRSVDTEKRKAALDCTFAAPKSVSLCALVGGDERLIKAHQDAVEKVLQLMEQEYAQTRVMLDGKTQSVVKTGNLVIAKYDHIETRELDPHLHSHCLVMNMTQLPNGEWYSHLNDAIFRNQKLLGMAYQHYLALEVQKLGYSVERRDHGQFEIKGYTEEQRLDFSKRRQQILARAGEKGSWLERELAWKKTRKNKEHVTPEELKARWLEQAQALGIEIVQASEPQLEVESLEVNPKLIVDAIAHCSERQVAFRPEEIKKFILSESLPLDVTKILPLLESNSELIRISEQQGIRYTTQAALQRELNTIRLMQQGQSKVPAVAQKEEAQQHLVKTTLNSGQRAAVLMATTTTDSVVAWQGVAGAGKTYALNEFRRIATDKGYQIKGYAPSAQAASVLGEEIGIESNTVARLLGTKQPPQVEPNQIWIIDEAGLLSAKDAHRLLERATQEQARVILVGDTKQLSAVEAGNPFKSLQQAGMKTAYLNESLRQRTPELKLAVDLVGEGTLEQGFARLEAFNSIQEVNQDALVDAIATEYMAGTPESRAKTLVLAGTNAERLEITGAIRARLKAEGSLGQPHATGQLKAKDLTSVQKGYTHHFEIGDVVMPIRDYKRRGLVKGALYSVIKKTQDSLSLQANDGTIEEVDLNFKKAVYQRHRIEIAVGDSLKWTKNDRQLGRRNGQEFIVTAITGNSAQIQYLDGTQSETINLAQAQHLDYALVSTTYSSQGKTADRVLVAADSTIGKESFYVAVSRARDELKLYTSDKAYLLQLARLTKAKENPLELLRQQVREQTAVESLVRASVTSEREVAKPKKPQILQAISSPTTPNAEERPTVPPPVKRSVEKKKQFTVSNQPVKQPSLLHTFEKPTNIVAIVKAANHQLPEPPEWLAFGKRVHCQNQGWGEVTAIKGARLVVLLDTGKQAQILSWPDAIESKSIVPEPVSAFWTPSSTGVPSAHIEPKHWQELVSGSAIHPEITYRNFRSLEYDMVEQAHSAWEYLFYSNKLERSNTGRLTSGTLKQYEHIEAGGWWCNAGFDPRCFFDLQPGQTPTSKNWGCYKPNAPRENPENPGKKIKYEHPLKADLSIFLLDVPEFIADRIYQKAGVKPLESDKASGFWYCVFQHNLPITITEGAKKAASLLSQGHAAIGLPGIYAGYRSKDEQGNEIKAHLHEELAVFATLGRDIRFAFDYETKPKTQRNIEIAISRTGSLLERQGAVVSVVRLPGPDKGVDDLIKMQGPLAYEKLEIEAQRLRVWREQNKAQQQTHSEPIGELSREERFERLQLKLANKLSSLDQTVNRAAPVGEIVDLEQSSVHCSPQPVQSQNITQPQENSYERLDAQQQQPTNGTDIVRRAGELFNPVQPTTGSSLPEPYQFATGPERQPFKPPAPDKLKWAAVRQYLTEKRSLPETLVEQLHQHGRLYADAQQNAVFLLLNEQGEITNANLRGTYKDSQFKGLVTGSRKDQGWFTINHGQGQLERIVLVESAMDAMSAAALALQKTGMTMFISTDGAGAVPIEMLRQHQAAGVVLMVGYDASPTGEEMAQIVLESLPGAKRVLPAYGKDWNEQLVHRVATIEAVNQLSERDFLKLMQGVAEYFRSSPPRPPSNNDRQIVQGEVDKLLNQINALWVLQASQVALVESMQLQPFHAWNNKYHEAVAQLESTMSLISQSIAEKDQKESQLKEWVKLASTYSAWDKEPHTEQLREFAVVLKLPQMQSRLANIQQQHQQQEPESLTELKLTELHEQEQQQRGLGRGR